MKIIIPLLFIASISTAFLCGYVFGSQSASKRWVQYTVSTLRFKIEQIRTETTNMRLPEFEDISWRPRKDGNILIVFEGGKE
jgi:hypothetical protein